MLHKIELTSRFEWENARFIFYEIEVLFQQSDVQQIG